MMTSVQLSATAKINLFLDITGRRADGYHLLSTVMQEISLADRVSLSLRHPDELLPTAVVQQVGKVRIARSNRLEQADIKLGLAPTQNLMVRAAQLYLETLPESYVSEPCVLELDLDKRLPAQAGIGGGSSDAAAVLSGLQQLFPDAVSRKKLFDLAVQLGADVPFCLHGGTAHCTGIGEVIRPLPALPKLPILIVKPDHVVSTAAAFRRWDQLVEQMDVSSYRPAVAPALEAIKNQHWEKLREVGANVFETVVLPEYAQLPKLLAAGYAGGAVYCRMTGSGSAIFAMYENEQTRDAAAADVDLWQQAAGNSGIRLFPCTFI